MSQSSRSPAGQSKSPTSNQNKKHPIKSRYQNVKSKIQMRTPPKRSPSPIVAKSTAVPKDHADKLFEVLKREQEAKNGLNTLVTELQGNYDQLLVKYAEAENFIDDMRFRRNTMSKCSEAVRKEREIRSTHQKFFSPPLNLTEPLQQIPVSVDDLNCSDFKEFRADSGFNGSENSLFSVEALSKMTTNLNFDDGEEDEDSVNSAIVTTRQNPNYFPMPCSSASDLDEIDEAFCQAESHKSVFAGEKQSLRLNSGNTPMASTPKTTPVKIMEETANGSPFINIYCYPQGEDEKSSKRRRPARRKRSASCHTWNESAMSKADVINLNKTLDQMYLEATEVKQKASQVWKSFCKAQKSKRRSPQFVNE